MNSSKLKTFLLFHDGGPYDIETSHLICSANQWIAFYMIGTSVKELIKHICKFLTLVSSSVKFL